MPVMVASDNIFNSEAMEIPISTIASQMEPVFKSPEEE